MSGAFKLCHENQTIMPPVFGCACFVPLCVSSSRLIFVAILVQSVSTGNPKPFVHQVIRPCSPWRTSGPLERTSQVTRGWPVLVQPTASLTSTGSVWSDTPARCLSEDCRQISMKVTMPRQPHTATVGEKLRSDNSSTSFCLLLLIQRWFVVEQAWLHFLTLFFFFYHIGFIVLIFFFLSCKSVLTLMFF